MHRLVLTPELAAYLNSPPCTDACHFKRITRAAKPCRLLDSWVEVKMPQYEYPDIWAPLPTPKQRDIERKTQQCKYKEKVVLLGSSGHYFAIMHDHRRTASEFKWQVATAESKKLLAAVQKCLTEEERIEGYWVTGAFTLTELGLARNQDCIGDTKTIAASPRICAELPTPRNFKLPLNVWKYIKRGDNAAESRTDESGEKMKWVCLTARLSHLNAPSAAERASNIDQRFGTMKETFP